MEFWDKLIGGIPRRIDFAITEHQIFSIGELPTITTPIPKEKYMSIYIRKDRGKIVLGVCILRNHEFSYKKGSHVGLTFEEFRKAHVFTGKIESISSRRRQFSEPEKEKITGIIDESLMEKYEILEISIVVLSSPKSHDRRDYIRHYSPPWTVYFKIHEYEPDELDSDTIHDISESQESLIESGEFEIDNGYCVVKTLDISAGGFRCRVPLKMPEHIEIDCLVLTNGNMLPATGVILSCTPDPKNIPNAKPYFQMRVQFTDISQTSRNEILKNIIAEERVKRRKQR